MSDTYSSASKLHVPAISFEKVYLVFCDLSKFLCGAAAQGIAPRWGQRSYIPSFKDLGFTNGAVTSDNLDYVNLSPS